MSTREMAKGLLQTCKSLRHLSTSAICLSSGSGMYYCSDHAWIQQGYRARLLLRATCKEHVFFSCDFCASVCRGCNRLGSMALDRRNHQAVPEAQQCKRLQPDVLGCF